MLRRIECVAWCGVGCMIWMVWYVRYVRSWLIKQLSEWASEWVSEWVSEWASEWVSEWASEWASERTSERVITWSISGQMQIYVYIYIFTVDPAEFQGEFSIRIYNGLLTNRYMMQGIQPNLLNVNIVLINWIQVFCYNMPVTLNRFNVRFIWRYLVIWDRVWGWLKLLDLWITGYHLNFLL